jgi:hypothetical protein
LNRYSGLIGTGWDRRLRIRPEPKIKIKSTFTIKILMGTGKGHTSRGHFTRKPVRTSVNTGDFDHSTRKVTRKVP